MACTDLLESVPPSTCTGAQAPYHTTFSHPLCPATHRISRCGLRWQLQAIKFLDGQYPDGSVRYLLYVSVDPQKVEQWLKLCEAFNLSLLLAGRGAGPLLSPLEVSTAVPVRQWCLAAHDCQATVTRVSVPAVSSHDRSRSDRDESRPRHT